MAVIYTNFARSIDPLEHRPAGYNMRAISSGRGYVVNGDIYYDNVHFSPVSESWISQEKLAGSFAAHDTYQGRVYAGVAGEVNLKFIAASAAPAAILFDINPLQRVFWQYLFEAIAQAPTPAEFVAGVADIPKRLFKEVPRYENGRPVIRCSSPFPQDHPISVEVQRKKVIAQHDMMQKMTGADDAHLQRALDRIKGTAYPDEEDCREKSSPIRNMTYKRFDEYFQVRLGLKEHSHWMGNADLDWLANPAFYNHIRQMVLNDAIATLTLDITDKHGCDQLAGVLANCCYERIDISESQTLETCKGAEIGTLYLSNVMYYLKWSEDEKQQAEKHGRLSADFCERAVDDDDVYRQCVENIGILTRDDAILLSFHHGSGAGIGTDFKMPYDLRTSRSEALSL